MTSNTPSRWIPLESNPDVLNAWANKAGLVESQFQFQDIYGLDKELLDMVPKPVKAVVLLFPIADDLEVKRKNEDETFEQLLKVDPTVVWIKQRIPNACGTIGLLHALLNSDVTFVPNSPLTKFLAEYISKSPEERETLLETTPLFADIHAEAANAGQSTVRAADMHTNLHFTCFVEAPAVRAPDEPTDSVIRMRVVELDGRRRGAVDRGESTDFLADVAKIVRETYLSQTSSMNFSMIALAPPL